MRRQCIGGTCHGLGQQHFYWLQISHSQPHTLAQRVQYHTQDLSVAVLSRPAWGCTCMGAHLSAYWGVQNELAYPVWPRTVKNSWASSGEIQQRTYRPTCTSANEHLDIRTTIHPPCTYTCTLYRRPVCVNATPIYYSCALSTHPWLQTALAHQRRGVAAPAM